MFGGRFGASSVTAEITLPAAATRHSTTPSQGTCFPSGSVLTCDLGPIASGASADVALSISFGSAGSHRLAAEVRASGTTVDPVASNDSATLDITIGQPTPSPTTSPRGITLLPDTSTPLGWLADIAFLATLSFAGVALTVWIGRLRSSSRR